MSRPTWFVNFLKLLYPSRRIFASMTQIPLVGGLIDEVFFKGDETYCLPKDQTIQINVPIDSPESVVLPSQVVEHVINQASQHWIMDFCICRESEGCQDYPRDLGCIFLGEPVSQINPELGRLVGKEEALEHARLCREAGLVHMIGRNRLDSIWLGAGPAEDLMTICNCCPCCCLWGVIPDLNPKISHKIDRMPGVEVIVEDNCTGCELCTNGICFIDAIVMENGRANITLECRGCGRCVEICPENAISLTINGREDFQEVISRLDKLINGE
jgi:Pyruvate/2-oxoacid:ferredoxin oxidoreductase delta subunit